MVLLFPLFLVCATAIRATSTGPALFRQVRVGLDGRRFQLLKFRTMRIGGAAGPAITAGPDPRITKVGRILRRLKLDELPQLFNVLKGEMALVGPRPEVPRYVELYPPAVRDVVLSVRPGMTDIASLVYIDESRLLGDCEDPERYYVEVIMPAKLALAAEYVGHRNWWLDLRIIAATATGILGLRWMPAPWNGRFPRGVSTGGSGAR
jgi:lipopolysaccharide/colanic/teichoic acid biosynthesis glycosyltransferase